MFYEVDRVEPVLRFGDILEGFILTTPNLVKDPTESNCCTIDIDVPRLCVLLTPCCSVRDKIISISPLIELNPSFFLNPYFTEDLTRINREVEARYTLPPERWEKLPEQEKIRRQNVGSGYVFLDQFIYEKNEHLTSYFLNNKKLGKFETNYYMIDYRNIYKINCEKIKSMEESLLRLKKLGM